MGEVVVKRMKMMEFRRHLGARGCGWGGGEREKRVNWPLLA